VRVVTMVLFDEATLELARQIAAEGG